MIRISLDLVLTFGYNRRSTLWPRSSSSTSRRLVTLLRWWVVMLAEMSAELAMTGTTRDRWSPRRVWRRSPSWGPWWEETSPPGDWSTSRRRMTRPLCSLSLSTYFTLISTSRLFNFCLSNTDKRENKTGLWIKSIIRSNLDIAIENNLIVTEESSIVRHQPGEAERGFKTSSTFNSLKDLLTTK